jgi:2,4-diketo-3-deoxy-L-fuconate hydrolase
MRVANVGGRATLLDSGGLGLDVEKASDGRFPSDPQSLFADWDRFRDWAGAHEGQGDLEVADAHLGAPIPRPGQVFAIGLNYDEHINESGMGRPPAPAVFTKFPSSISGPRDEISLPSSHCDWEVEMVVAIGRRAYLVDEGKAWDHVAGIMVGQDLSERVVQLQGPIPQFSLGKSFLGFAPIGPALVTVDEIDDPENLEIGCRLDDEVMQLGCTKDLIFGVAELIAKLSAVCPMLPGDIIFTGTPSGVGQARDPQRFIPPGSVLTSHIAGLGELRNSFVAGPTFDPTA